MIIEICNFYFTVISGPYANDCFISTLHHTPCHVNIFRAKICNLNAPPSDHQYYVCIELDNYVVYGVAASADLHMCSNKYLTTISE